MCTYVQLSGLFYLAICSPLKFSHLAICTSPNDSGNVIKAENPQWKCIKNHFETWFIENVDYSKTWWLHVVAEIIVYDVIILLRCLLFTRHNEPWNAINVIGMINNIIMV